MWLLLFSAELAERIRVELDERNLTMAAVSGTFNMIHPNPRKRRDGLRSSEYSRAFAAS